MTSPPADFHGHVDNRFDIHRGRRLLPCPLSKIADTQFYFVTPKRMLRNGKRDKEKFVLRRATIIVLLLQFAALAQAKEYGHYDVRYMVAVKESEPGKPTATLQIAYLDQMISDLATHASTWPPHFDSTEDRHRAEQDITAICTALDILAENFSHNPPMLMRLALLHAMGHNLDIAGSAQKAIANFTKWLELTPDDPQANFRYGAFLASTAKKGAGIPYLEKAKRLGVVDADFWLGVSYQVVGDKAKAIENLESYTKRVPTDATAAAMLDASRHDKVDIKEVKPGDPPFR
jgi:tetratricopeptide (TPR) repeat protein